MKYDGTSEDVFVRATAAFPSSEVLWLQTGGCRFSKCACGSCSGHVRLGNVAVARVSGTPKIAHAYKTQGKRRAVFEYVSFACGL